MEELEKLKKEIEEVLEKVNKKLEEYGKQYWLLSNHGNIIYSVNSNDPIDNLRKEMGNYFKTKKEAEEHLEDLKIKTEIKNIAKELNGDKKIDWDDDNQPKYYLIYRYGASEVSYNLEYSWKTEGIIYCLDSDFMNVCIEKIGKERLENYLKRN